MRNYNEKYLNTQKGRANNLLCGYKTSDRKYERIDDEFPTNYVTAKWIVEHIFSQPCKHCGETDWHKLGCNRLDNSLPHTMDNVEPCCVECNNELASIERGNKCSKQVYQYTLDGTLVAIWKSASEAARQLGFNHSSIATCCRGGRINKGKWEKCKTYKGYIWSFLPL